MMTVLRGKEREVRMETSERAVKTRDEWLRVARDVYSSTLDEERAIQAANESISFELAD